MRRAKATRTVRKGSSLADVARLAGVSPQTASRVSTGSNQVSSKTAARVRAAMEALEYVPNHAARALRHGSYRAIGAVTQQLERTGEALTVGGIVSEADGRGYSVTVIQAGEPQTGDVQRSLTRLAKLPIDGLIVVNTGLTRNALVNLPPNLPVVVCDMKLAESFPAVVGDEDRAIRDLMEHLYSLGHRNIHHLAGAQDSHAAAVRETAWRDSMLDAGLAPGKKWQGDWTMSSGYATGLKIAEDPTVTAVSCANDEMAFGLIEALKSKGLRVPQDISVVGFDGCELSEFSNPPITTAKQDFRRHAAEAVRALIDQIDGRRPAPQQVKLLPVKVLVRESTGPVSLERRAVGPNRAAHAGDETFGSEGGTRTPDLTIMSRTL